MSDSTQPPKDETDEALEQDIPYLLTFQELSREIAELLKIAKVTGFLKTASPAEVVKFRAYVDALQLYLNAAKNSVGSLVEEKEVKPTRSKAKKTDAVRGLTPISPRNKEEEGDPSKRSDFRPRRSDGIFPPLHPTGSPAAEGPETTVEYYDEKTGRIVLGKLSLGRYLQAWDKGHLKFQHLGVEKPSHLPTREEASAQLAQSMETKSGR